MNRKNRSRYEEPSEVEQANAIDIPIDNQPEEDADDTQEQNSTVEQSNTQTKLPEQATGPASAPESNPEAAGSRPASTPAPSPVRRPAIDFLARADKCPELLAQMNEAQKDKYQGHPPEYAEYMTTLVPTQAIERITGRIGLRFTFDFHRGTVIMLPRWFAVSYPDALVIKE